MTTFIHNQSLNLDCTSRKCVCILHSFHSSATDQWSAGVSHKTLLWTLWDTKWAKWTKCYLDWQLLHNLCYIQLTNLAKKIPTISSQQSDYQDLGGWVLIERQVEISEIGIVSPNQRKWRRRFLHLSWVMQAPFPDSRQKSALRGRQHLCPAFKA